MPESKGHLNPGAPGVELFRFGVGADLEELVRHIWVARWDLPEGETSRQRVLTYPTFNLVVMGRSARLYGPDPRVQVRELVGRGFAVGLLLRPAAGRLLGAANPVDLVGTSCPIERAPIEEIELILKDWDEGQTLLGPLISNWLGPLADRIDESGRLTNRICRIVEEDATLVLARELAARAGLSPRSLERLTMAQIGITPKWLIECRRLQEAATALRTNPSADLSELAVRLGYVDYSHFSRRYKEVLGETPEQSRASFKV